MEVMLLGLHISIALSGLIVTGMSYFKPSKSKLNVAYGLVVCTIASGTALVIVTHSPLVSACLSGLLYLGVAMLGIILSRRKLAKRDLDL